MKRPPITITRREARDCWEAVSELREQILAFSNSVEGPASGPELRQLDRLAKLEEKFKKVLA